MTVAGRGPVSRSRALGDRLFKMTVVLCTIVLGSAALAEDAGVAGATLVPRGDAVLVVGTHHYQLQIAVTDAQQALGLGDRARMPLDDGMLFIFPSSGTRCFWMKGMQFALDIIWLSSANEVVYMKPDLSPKTYPASYCAQAQNVIELNAGQAHRAGISLDRTVKLEVPVKLAVQA